jgi:hypothetical protein
MIFSKNVSPWVMPGPFFPLKRQLMEQAARKFWLNTFGAETESLVKRLEDETARVPKTPPVLEMTAVVDSLKFVL